LNVADVIFVFPSWNEWITLPIKYCDLPRNAQLCLSIYECCGPGKYIAVGGTTVPFFGKLGVYKQVLSSNYITHRIHNNVS
jgi:Phosphoinositide 3-kinase C2